MSNSPLPKIFVGSSFQSLVFAHTLREKLKDKAELIVWDEYFFSKVWNTKNNFYDVVKTAAEEFEYGIFIFGPTHEKASNLTKEVPYIYGTSENVWLETGLFISECGDDRVLLVIEKSRSGDFEIDIPSDLSGRELSSFVAPASHYNKELPFNYLNCKDKDHRCSWDNIGETRKEEYGESLNTVANNILEMIKNGVNEVRPKIISNREQCYLVAKQMIERAEVDEDVFTIMAFEGEITSMEDENKSLLSTIKNRIERTKEAYAQKYNKDNFEELSFEEKEKCRELCFTHNRRLINLHDNELAKQAYDVVENYSGYIKIRDTYCRYVELVLAGDEVLILYPKFREKKPITSYGLYLKNGEFAEKMQNWFLDFAKCPTDLEIDTKKQLDSYRNEIEWPSKYRNSKKACTACILSLEQTPDVLREQFKDLGLISLPQGNLE
jgi:hypothetical protein